MSNGTSPEVFGWPSRQKQTEKKLPIMIIKIQKIITQEQDKVKIKCAAVDEQG